MAHEVQSRATDGFGEWFLDAQGSLVITTYQAGHVALVGWDGRQISVFLRHFDKPMGLAVQGDQLALVTRRSVVLLANSPLQAAEYPPDNPAGHDCLYLPRATYYTSDLHVHDVAYGDNGELWIVNTRFSCLATLSRQFSFQPQWQPPFVSQLVPEDRCHLNGVALDSGRPRFVTALGEADEADGWRGSKAHGGVVIDVASGETLLRGLSMPHSPRWHDGMLWFLESGRGNLCVVQPGHDQPTVVCHLPGYVRGLCFVGMYAVVGLSLIRERRTFGDLPIEEGGETLRCGIGVVDLRSGRLAGLLEFTSGWEEIYEVQFLAGVRRPMMLNTADEVAGQAISAPGFAYWMRPRAAASDDGSKGSAGSP